VLSALQTVRTALKCRVQQSIVCGPVEQEGAIFYDPIMLTVLDPEGSELGVAAGLCDVST